MALAWFLLCFSLPFDWPGYEAPMDEDDVALQEEVDFLLANPIDLNRAAVEDLLVVPWLNPLLAYRIIAFRDSLGAFAGTARLRDVPGMTEEQYESLLPVVAVVNKPEPGWTGAVLGRAVTDTVPPSISSWSSFGRVRVSQGPWLGSAVIDKDRGERSWTDWVGIGLQFSGRRAGVTLGDYTIGSGLGLVFSGPYTRAASAWAEGSTGPSKLRLAGSALENRSLRGLGTEFRLGGWQLTGSGSVASRDAKLNTDGTVERLVLSGVHDDSSSLASRNRVQEASVGAVLARHWHNLRLSAAGCGVRYNRAFAPRDSTDSFHGNSLAAGGIGIEANAGVYLVAVEAAVSSGGGGSGALELNGDWQGLTVELGATGYDRRYFAPMSRWRPLTDRQSRLDCRARIGYRVAGFRFNLRGNTYRDYELDSLPAKLEAGLAYDAGRLSAELRLGRSYRLEQERFRNTRFVVTYKPFQRSEGALTFADDYPELGTGRGMMLGLAAKVEPALFWLALTAARFDITGSGIRMYLSEYGPMRTGFSFSTGSSAWRAGLGFGIKLKQGTGFGLRFGYTYKNASVLEFGTQFELGLGS